MRTPTPLGFAMQHALFLLSSVLFSFASTNRYKRERRRDRRERLTGERRGERERERYKENSSLASLRPRAVCMCAWRCLDSIYTSKAVKGDIIARPDFTRCRLVHRPGGWYRIWWGRARKRDETRVDLRERFWSRGRSYHHLQSSRSSQIVLIVWSSGRCRVIVFWFFTG